MDAKYNFILFDIGEYGSNSDCGVLSKSAMRKLLESKCLNIPEPASLEGCEYDPLPYFLLADEAFPLKEYMMRPFPGQLHKDEQVLNYRQSTGRRVIENTFMILRACWRILGRPIKATVENVERYLLAIIALHNYLRQTENVSYCPTGFVDCKSSNGIIKPGE